VSQSGLKLFQKIHRFRVCVKPDGTEASERRRNGASVKRRNGASVKRSIAWRFGFGSLAVPMRSKRVRGESRCAVSGTNTASRHDAAGRRTPPPVWPPKVFAAHQPPRRVRGDLLWLHLSWSPRKVETTSEGAQGPLPCRGSPGSRVQSPESRVQSPESREKTEKRPEKKQKQKRCAVPGTSTASGNVPAGRRP